MLKKGLRLRKKEDFNRIFRYSKLIFFNGIGCRYLFHNTKKVSSQELLNQSSLRVGFVFSKKHLPLATQRNRLRRVLSEAIFQLKYEWPENADIVFFTIKKPKNIISTQTSLLIIKYFLKHIKEVTEKQKRK
jgi:ribonuclease P protein component